MRKIRIFFLIRSLDLGGAERQLGELVRGLSKQRFSITVATYYRNGTLSSEIERLEGVKVIELWKKGRWDVLPFFLRLWRTVRDANPDILHGYLGIANELCLMIGRAFRTPVVWGLRSSYMDFSRYDWAARLSFRTGAWLSRFADLIIVNSQAGKQYHIANKYSGDHMVVIPNGIDTERYCPDALGRSRMRQEWGIGEDKILIGLVGRLDPMKDHPTFLHAAAMLSRERQDLLFVCVGDGTHKYKMELKALADRLNLMHRLTWAGSLTEVNSVYNALDIAVSSSYGEGFPNVVAEAMASGVPCIVTDVGDSAHIVGDPEQVVPAKDPQALAAAVKNLLRLSAIERKNLGTKARERIVTKFSTPKMVSRSESLFLNLLRGAKS